MKEKQKMPSTGFVVIRCDDRRIVARLSSFPVCERALMYRRGDLVSFMPLKGEGSDAGDRAVNEHALH